MVLTSLSISAMSVSSSHGLTSRSKLRLGNDSFLVCFLCSISSKTLFTDSFLFFSFFFLITFIIIRVITKKIIIIIIVIIRCCWYLFGFRYISRFRLSSGCILKFLDTKIQSSNLRTQRFHKFPQLCIFLHQISRSTGLAFFTGTGHLSRKCLLYVIPSFSDLLGNTRFTFSTFDINCFAGQFQRQILCQKQLVVVHFCLIFWSVKPNLFCHHFLWIHFDLLSKISVK